MNTSKILLGFLILLLLASPITAISLLALTKPIPTYVPSAPFTMPLFKLTCGNKPPCNIDPCGTYNTYNECTDAANNCNVKIQCHVNGVVGYPDGTCETVTCGQQVNNWMSPPFTGTTCNAMTISNCQDIADNLHTECNAQTGKCDIVESCGYSGYCGAVTCKENCIQYYYTCNTDGTCSVADETTPKANLCTNTFGSQCCVGGNFINPQSGYCKQPSDSTICYTAGNDTVGGICAPSVGGSTSCPGGGTSYTTLSDCLNKNCTACGACVSTDGGYATCKLSGCDVCNDNGTATTPCYTLPSDSDASYCDAENTCACRYQNIVGWEYVETSDKTTTCSNAQCLGCTPIYVGDNNCGGGTTTCEYIPKICSRDTCNAAYFTCEYMQVSDINPQPTDVMVCPTGARCTIGLPLPNDANGYDESLYMCDDLITPCKQASVVWPEQYKEIINQLSINNANQPGNCSAASPCEGTLKNTNC